MSKTTKAKQQELKLTEKAGTVAHNVFLANLGVCGKIYEQSETYLKQSRDKVRELYNQRSKIYKDLVKRGEKLQSKTLSRLEQLKNEQKAALDQRLQTVRSRFDKLKGEETQQSKAKAA